MYGASRWCATLGTAYFKAIVGPVAVALRNAGMPMLQSNAQPTANSQHMTYKLNLQRWLAVVCSEDVAATLQASLTETGLRVVHAVDGTELVQCSMGSAPDAVVLALDLPETALGGDALALLTRWDVPILGFGAAIGLTSLGPSDLPNHAIFYDQQHEHEHEHEQEHGQRPLYRLAHHWVADIADLSGANWLAALAFAKLIHHRQAALVARVDELENGLVKRKAVERAKGLLMTAQGISEEDAFARLRRAAMQNRQSMAATAQSVVDAATWSEAVNRAGQLRWMSQRCIAAAAQRLARIDPPAARKIQQRALRRADDICTDLARMPLPQAAQSALNAVDQVRRVLNDRLDLRLGLDNLAQANKDADEMLQKAEELVSCLQTAGANPILRVINMCGRQRMRAQRIVKLGLLMQLSLTSDEPALADHASELVVSFGATLSELAQLPLGSEAISAAHQAAVRHWSDMTQAIQLGEMAAVVQSGESLIGSVDALTLCWERSLQLVLG